MKKSIHSWLLLVVLTVLTACVSTAIPSQTISTTTTAPAIKTACQPSRIQISKNEFPEIQGTMNSAGELWALLFFDKAHAKQDLKIVWRMTGSSEQFSIQARHADGTVTSPSWGPEYHGSSNWERPGTEWGTGFNFPKPGCWTLTATRGSTLGEIYLEVLAP
jgi:hypothetical protein